MGAAASSFSGKPNLEGMRALVARYEALKAADISLSSTELYDALEQELNRLVFSSNPTRGPDFGFGSVSAPHFRTGASFDEERATHTSVLVVDDSNISAKLAQRALSMLHFEAIVVDSGPKALAMLQESPARFNLVLLDIVMPGMDGVQVLTTIKGSKEFGGVPVAMLSGLEDQALAEMCLQQGAVEVLLKPLKPDAVSRVIQQHCAHRVSELDTPSAVQSAVGDATVGKMDASDLTNQILLLFFPAAFASEGQCSNQLLSRINRQYMAFRSLNTEVYGVGHELPFSLKALKAKLQLQFTLLSDPSRSFSSHCVGTMDFGKYLIQSSGIHMPHLRGYRTSNAGLLLLNENRTVMMKWTSARNDGTYSLYEYPDVKDVFTALQQATNISLSAQNDMQRVSIRNAGRVSILVVDDSNISSKLAVRKLAGLGHDTMHAEHGQVAFDLLQRFPTDFDVVILDIVMPVMDGVELLNIMKADDNLKHIPVLMLSGLEDDVLANACLDAGAAEVLQKPLEIAQITALFSQLNIHPRS